MLSIEQNADHPATIRDVIGSLLLHPSRGWGDSHRQAIKLDTRMGAIANALGLDRQEAIEEIIAIAQVRRRFARPTVYISNVGSSGSHWLQAMIAGLAAVLPCGEVYLPELLRSRLAKCPVGDAQLLLQAVYVVHGFRNSPASLTGYAVNTAHVARVKQYSQYDIHNIRILLTRNPIDIVLSRTFRKSEYREYLGQTSAADTDYLKANIARVLSFYEAVRIEDFDLICSFEELCHKPVEVLKQLSILLKVDVPEARFKHIAHRLSAQNLAREGRAAQTNIYQGECAAIPHEYVKIAQHELRPAMERFGYTHSQAEMGTSASDADNWRA